MKTTFLHRRGSLVAKFAGVKLDALLVTHPADWFYLTAFTGDSGALIVSPRAATLITDGRFTGQAKEETFGVNIALQKGAVFAATGEFLAASKIKSIGFDPTHISVTQMAALRKAAGRGCRWIAAPGLVADLRMRKDAQ